MTIDTNTLVSISDANQNFSKATRLVADEEVIAASKKLMKKNKRVYEVLAK